MQSGLVPLAPLLKASDQGAVGCREQEAQQFVWQKPSAGKHWRGPNKPRAEE